MDRAQNGPGTGKYGWTLAMTLLRLKAQRKPAPPQCKLALLIPSQDHSLGGRLQFSGRTPRI
jgi:hypothetical protein